MGLWEFLMYIAAAFLAMRSLVSLMFVHRQNFQSELIAEMQAEIDAAGKKGTGKPAPKPKAKKVGKSEPVTFPRVAS